MRKASFMQGSKGLKSKQFKRFKLTVKSKLMLALLGVSLGSILVVGYISLERGRTILKESIFNQLTSIRTSKAHQFELFFENLRNQVEVFCQDKMFVAAMVEFRAAYDEIEQLESDKIPEGWDQKIAAYYTDEFFPRLTKNISGDPVLNVYQPIRPAAKYLQYHYIANNPQPVGEKNALVEAKDGSTYSQIHKKYHHLFDDIVQKFGYYDLFLIDPETGNIVYSVYKETDYATSLLKGPYRRSNLAKAVDAVLDNPEQGAIQLLDFESYRPSYAAPAAFLAGPIYDGPKMVGILAIQLPVEQINRVMTSGQDWQGQGLGETGETYLVGSDRLMRSVSRFLIETPDRFKRQLRSQGTPSEKIQLMENFGTTILVQEVNTIAAQQALSGKEGTQVVDDYRGVPVLSSYGMLDVEGLRWAILAERDIAEVYKPLGNLRRSIFNLTVLLILLVTGIATFLATRFVKPIKLLSEGARKVGEGQLDTEVKLNSEDEFGELAQMFNTMVHNLRAQQLAIATKDRENDSLLQNILPQTIAERRKQGEENIADLIQQATVLVATATGFVALSEQLSVSEAAALLNELISGFDRAAEKHAVEKLKVLGERYVAVCGLTKQRLDHTKRMMDFALEIWHLLQGFNRKHDVSLGLRIGLHSGPVKAAVMGDKQFGYNLWGETMDLADRLNIQAEAGTMLVSQAVHDSLQELYTFEPGHAIASETNDNIQTWILRDFDRRKREADRREREADRRQRDSDRRQQPLTET